MGTFFKSINCRQTLNNGDVYADGDFIRWCQLRLSGGSTTSAAGIQPGNPLTIKYKFTIYEHATVTQANPMPTVKKTVDAIRISFFDLDHSTTPGCNANNAAAEAFSWVSPANTAPCTISSSGTNAQSASGKASTRQSCAACDFCGWHAMGRHEHPHSGHSAVNGISTGAPNARRATGVKSAFERSLGQALPPSTMSKSGSTPVFSAVSGYNVPVGKWSRSNSRTRPRYASVASSWASVRTTWPHPRPWSRMEQAPWTTRRRSPIVHRLSSRFSATWATQRTISMDGVTEARSVLFVYENTDTIPRLIRTTTVATSHRPWRSRRNVLAGQTQLRGLAGCQWEHRRTRRLKTGATF